MIARPSADRLAPWVLRALWVAVLVAGGTAIDEATAERSDAVDAVATWGGAALWGVGVAALAVPAVVTLTAARVVVPLGPIGAVVAAIGGAGTGPTIAFLATTIAAAAVAVSTELARSFVQASAYGAEDRHPLRPPPAYALAAVLVWLVWASALFAGPLLLAARAWVLGTLVTLVAVVGAIWSWPRWHQLARRWLVLVPAGVVVHDPLVLAETLMIRRPVVGGLRLAPADTGAADLTGPAGGHTIEVLTNETVTAVLSGGRGEPRPIHLTACLVAPSRPGRALAAAAERRFRVG